MKTKGLRAVQGAPADNRNTKAIATVQSEQVKSKEVKNATCNRKPKFCSGRI